jgi:hypothetical protein
MDSKESFLIEYVHVAFGTFRSDRAMSIGVLTCKVGNAFQINHSLGILIVFVIVQSGSPTQTQEITINEARRSLLNGGIIAIFESAKADSWHGDTRRIVVL